MSMRLRSGLGRGPALLALGAVLVVGCEVAPKIPSPKEVFEKYKAAAAEGAYEKVFDMLSKSARDRAGTSIRQLAEKSASLGPMAKAFLGFDPAELGGLPPRDAFAKLMRSTAEAGRKMSRRPGAGSASSEELAAMKVTSENVRENDATLTLEGAGGRVVSVRLVLEEGAWRFSSLPALELPELRAR